MGKFYDHAEGEYIWGQDLVYTYYTDEKTGYPLDFLLYEEDNTKIEQAKDMIEDAEENADVPAETHLFDCLYCAAELIETVGEYEKDWISVPKAIAMSSTMGKPNALTPSTTRST